VSVVAVVRPDSWDLPLFLHVLGATVLFGGVAAVAIIGIAARRAAVDRSPILRRIAFRTLLFVVLPAFILNRVAAQWIVSKEYPHHEPDWVGVGYAVTEPGAVVLLALIVVAFLAMRRGRRGLTTAIPVLAGVYLAALAVAMFAMTAKPGG
jgi:hypothetical protein